MTSTKNILDIFHDFSFQYCKEGFYLYKESRGGKMTKTTDNRNYRKFVEYSSQFEKLIKSRIKERQLPLPEQFISHRLRGSIKTYTRQNDITDYSKSLNNIILSVSDTKKLYFFSPTNVKRLFDLRLSRFMEARILTLVGVADSKWSDYCMNGKGNSKSISSSIMNELRATSGFQKVLKNTKKKKVEFLNVREFRLLANNINRELQLRYAIGQFDGEKYVPRAFKHLLMSPQEVKAAMTTAENIEKGDDPEVSNMNESTDLKSNMYDLGSQIPWIDPVDLYETWWGISNENYDSINGCLEAYLMPLATDPIAGLYTGFRINDSIENFDVCISKLAIKQKYNYTFNCEYTAVEISKDNASFETDKCELRNNSFSFHVQMGNRSYDFNLFTSNLSKCKEILFSLYSCSSESHHDTPLTGVEVFWPCDNMYTINSFLHKDEVIKLMQNYFAIIKHSRSPFGTRKFFTRVTEVQKFVKSHSIEPVTGTFAIVMKKHDSKMKGKIEVKNSSNVVLKLDSGTYTGFVERNKNLLQFYLESTQSESLIMTATARFSPLKKLLKIRGMYLYNSSDSVDLQGEFELNAK